MTKKVFVDFYQGTNSEKTARGKRLVKSLKDGLFRYPAVEVEDVCKSDIIFLVGGDGTVLQLIRKYLHLNIPFLGVNGGTEGTLCLASEETLNGVLRDVFHYFNSLAPKEFDTFSVEFSGQVETAIQDLRVERPDHTAIKLKIIAAKQILAERHLGDGVIISGAIGSTAYNASAGGPTISHLDKAVILTPVAPFKGKAGVYDSILSPLVFSDPDFTIVPLTPGRLVLDNRPFEVEAGTKIKINRGRSKFKLYI